LLERLIGNPLYEFSSKRSPHNNRVAADDIKILVVMQESLAAAEHERYAAELLVGV
jgi:hypothetical protein